VASQRNNITIFEYYSLKNQLQGAFLSLVDNKEQQQIPFGDDNKKGNDSSNSNGDGRSLWGMAKKKAKTTATTEGVPKGKRRAHAIAEAIG